MKKNSNDVDATQKESFLEAILAKIDINIWASLKNQGYFKPSWGEVVTDTIFRYPDCVLTLEKKISFMFKNK